MKWVRGLIAVVLVLTSGFGAGQAQAIPGGHYFGQTPPGYAPVVFAPGIISLSDRYEYCLVFSPSLDECVFGVTNSTWGVFNLWYTKMGADSSWIDPVPAPFQGSGDGLFPAYSGDGAEMSFASMRPSNGSANVWQSLRAGSGWSAPLLLDPPINSTSNEWGGSLTDDGTFYFSSERPGGFGGADLYRAVTSPGGEVTVENLGATVNSAQLEGSACVARDGSYLIFESQRPGGYGVSDLYITFNENNVWTTPRNLGPGINTSWFEDGASISPDGKYFFFNRRRAWVTSTQTEIWWVDLQVVFHPELSDAPDPGGSTGQVPMLRNEPNPFGSSTTIAYTTPAPGPVTVQIFDVLGREVSTLVHDDLAAGAHAVRFDVPPGEGSASGVYYCRLRLGDQTLKTTRMVSLE